MSAREKIVGLFPSRSLGESVADEVLAEHRAEIARQLAASRLPGYPDGERASLVEASMRAIDVRIVRDGEEAAYAVAVPEVTTASDRCPSCFCGACGGRLDQHTATGCECGSCAPDPSLACSLAEFMPSRMIAYLAEQLGPLLSAHLNERLHSRCLAVAHVAHHALLDYDRKD